MVAPLRHKQRIAVSISPGSLHQHPPLVTVCSVRSPSHILVRPDTPDRDRLVEALPHILSGSLPIEKRFKDDRKSTVALMRVGDQPWVVKQLHLNLFKRLIHRLGRGGAWIEWRNATCLAQADIHVAKPAAICLTGNGATLITPYVTGTSLYHYLFDAPPLDNRDSSERENIATMVGRQIGLMFSAGWVNRDHKPSNLIIHQISPNQNAQPILIDPAGLRPFSSTRAMRMMVNFMRSVYQAGAFTREEWDICLRAAEATNTRDDTGDALRYDALDQQLGPPPPKDPDLRKQLGIH